MLEKELQCIASKELKYGKTGTVEIISLNNEKTQLTDHSIFVSFAPKENPKIAIAFIENGYWGARCCPIGSLMIEKYLKGKVMSILRQKMINGSLITEYQKPF